MDKKKQIEEMARIIAFDLCPNRRIHANYGEEAQCYSDTNFAECTKIKNVVDKLYNAGYRKITENAVVLTREEQQKYAAYKIIEPQIRGCLDRERELEKRLENSRKETAEKFAERLKAKCEYNRKEYRCSATVGVSDIDEICKEFTEGKE